MFGIIIPSAFAVTTIQGDNIPQGIPYGCISQDVMVSQKHSMINISIKAYTPNSDVNVVILADEKTIKNKSIPIKTWTPVSTIYSSPYYNPESSGRNMNSITIEFCLLNTSLDDGEKILKFDNQKVMTDTKPLSDKFDSVIVSDSPKNYPQYEIDIPTPSSPVIEKKEILDCTPNSINVPNESSGYFSIKVGNPNSEQCKYEVSLYDLQNTKLKSLGTMVFSGTFVTKQIIPDGNYHLQIISFDRSYFEYFPLNIQHPISVQKPLETSSDSSLNPLLLLIIPIIIVIVIVIAIVTKKKSTIGSEDNKTKPTSPPPVDPKHKKESPRTPIQSGPQKEQKKSRPTKTKPSQKTVTSTSTPPVDSEIDRILNSTNPLDVLGLPTSVSFSVIKTTYRELYKKYDPSRGISNKSDIEKERDQKISTKLNHAYAQLKRQNRG